MTDDLHKRAFCECPRCGQLEQYGCRCTMIEMLDWHRDERAALLARLEAVEKERDAAKESARWAYIDGCLDGDDDLVLVRAEKAEADLTAAYRAGVEDAAGRASSGASRNDIYSKGRNDAAAAIRALPTPAPADLAARLKEPHHD